MRKVKNIIKISLFIGLPLLMSAAFAYEEKVRLKTVLSDSEIVVKRSNDEVYKLEIGLGCRAMLNYQGKKIIIYTMGSKPMFNEFIDMSSKILLKKADQQCTIWHANKLPTTIKRKF